METRKKMCILQFNQEVNVNGRGIDWSTKNWTFVVFLPFLAFYPSSSSLYLQHQTDCSGHSLCIAQKGKITYIYEECTMYVCNFFSKDTIFGSIFPNAKVRKSQHKNVLFSPKKQRELQTSHFITEQCQIRQNTMKCAHYFST